MSKTEVGTTAGLVPQFPKPLTVRGKGAAAMIGVQRTTLNKWRKAGLIRSCKIGASRLYFVDSIEEFLATAEPDKGAAT